MDPETERRGYAVDETGSPDPVEQFRMLMSRHIENLARVPSPITRKFLYLPCVITSLRGWESHAVQDLHHKYAPVVDLFLSRLDEKRDQTQPLNMMQGIEFLAFDITGSPAFTSSFRCLEDQGYHLWVLLLLDFFNLAHRVLAARMSGIFFRLVLVLAPIRDLRKGQEQQL
ncbi:hypothetical protein C8A03DRAFT_37614 [Achaetomium macrosporum]|uniref:Uncharacterized protein n=1 Tax=Achaetomium macrosporum TaxID=79813 RepID=A0AAN7C3E8_9PEZI|nr:hypothetical protein C8A03DRAFT_37614 [Achaetomium macrosporum]